MRKRASHFLVQLAVALIFVAPVLAQTSKDLPLLAAVERELKGGETHSYRVLLNPNQFLHAIVEQKDIDIATAVFAPDGKQLTDSDSPNDRWGSEPILWVASVAGEYRVDVRSSNSKAPAGRYEIKILALREATQIDKDHLAAQLAFDEGRKLRAQQTTAAKRAAIEKYELALPIFKSAGDKYREALTLHSIGMSYYPLNEFQKSLDHFDKARVLAIAVGDRRLEAAIETWIGGMLDILGDVSKALDHHLRALTLARAVNSRLAEGSALASIGKIYIDAADWQKALEISSLALPVFRAIGYKKDEAIALNNIGIAYFWLGENQKALDYLQQSLPLQRAGGDKNSEAGTLLNIARIHRRAGEYEKAKGYYNQVQALQRETGNRPLEGETLDEIGLAYSAEGQNEKAVEFHRRAVEIQHAVGNLRREALARNNLGDAYNFLEQPDKAVEQFNEAVAIFRSIADLRSAAASLEGIARAERQRGNLVAARKHIEESLTLRETVRSRSGSLQLRASYRATIEKAYEFYIDLLMQQHAKDPAAGFDAEALAASERGRARSLLEKLNEASIDIRQGVGAVLIETERDLTRVLNAKAQREMQLKARKAGVEEIATIQREMSALEDEYQQVQASIRRSSPQYAALTQPRPLGLKDIQQQLDPNSVLLEYTLGQERSYVWVVTQNSLRSYQLPRREVIENTARDVCETLTERSVSRSPETPAQRNARVASADADFQRSATMLSQLILSPVAAELGNKRLIVVADGALQYVPFAALPNAKLTHPLIIDHEVVSLPSASAFAIQRRNLEGRAPAPKAVAVIADPVFSAGDTRLKASAQVKAAGETEATRIIEHLQGSGTGQIAIPRLVFTRREADQIRAVAPGASSMTALDFRANRAIATSGELSKYRYVHFATHGYVDTLRAGLSAIVLSLVDEQGKPQDGFLRTHDIYNLNLPAELVVLSACQTALGKDVTGEGLDGLTRAFMYAGARRLVVSLWSVNDQATAALMQRFYVEMLKNNRTPAAALRAAQIELSRTRRWQSPYYWAAFVMQGEWN